MCRYTTLWKRSKLLLSVCCAHEWRSANQRVSAGRHRPDLHWSRSKGERRLLPWRAPVTAAVANDANSSSVWCRSGTASIVALGCTCTPRATPMVVWSLKLSLYTALQCYCSCTQHIIMSCLLVIHNVDDWCDHWSHCNPCDPVVCSCVNLWRSLTSRGWSDVITASFFTEVKWLHCLQNIYELCESVSSLSIVHCTRI